MLDLIGRMYIFIFGRVIFSKLNKALFYLSSRGLGVMNYTSDKISGEHYVAKMFLNKPGMTVFDVGANKGAWAKMVIKENPSTFLHVFEPQLGLAENLVFETDRVWVNHVAVGSAPSILKMYDYKAGEGSEHASLVENLIESVHGAESCSFEVEVITLADYCAIHNLSSIDFLKVDVEGFEMEVFKGAAQLISQGRVQVIQFEFNEMNVMQRVFFKDFYNLLSEGYSLYRILPAGLLPIKVYSAWFQEQFAFQNILAVKK